ncbi:ABC transporter substrate-binding protein [Anoxynatronum buryatiense]|uniref:ABC-type Fe3+ transport system, substrate-binding protein n=1 Tax=Anoxynatronum buryatiense TaxID=489973 RepID=A0AA46AKN2_9CLOT|nr:ABC transporter substrate-binding protein [Anoxynatronum buryatiense]SMP71136.1 ABC-type Fe3+ transport system, substrate-binding protein [Anoxynatronum buryatiense]
MHDSHQEIRDALKVNFLGLIPCALKVPFEERLDQFVEAHPAYASKTLAVVANANRQLDYFEVVDQLENPDDLPEIFIAPGFNGFYNHHFMRHMKDTGVYQTLNQQENCPQALRDAGVLDPEGHYTLLGFNPTLLMVDRTFHQDLPVPRRWEDLLDPVYEGKVAIRGHNDEDFCEGILLNVYQEHGMEGVAQMGRSLKMGLHPAQMVKMAGKGKAEAPAVAAIPYSFSKLIRETDQVTLVWPEDGAILNPITCLVKQGAQKTMPELCQLLASDEMAAILSGVGFPPVNAHTATGLPGEITYKWLGWDFLRNHSLEDLKDQTNQVFVQAFREVSSCD